MSALRPSLTIAYTGELVAVDPERITEEMFVPNVGYDDDLRADDQPGASAVSLFREAESEGALVIPDSSRSTATPETTFASAGSCWWPSRPRISAQASPAAGVTRRRSHDRAATSERTTIQRS